MTTQNENLNENFSVELKNFGKQCEFDALSYSMTKSLVTCNLNNK